MRTRTVSLAVAPIVKEWSDRAEGFCLSDVMARLSATHPHLKRQSVSTRLSNLGLRRELAVRFIAERESHGDLLRYFGSEHLAELCPGVVRTRAETKVVLYTHPRTYGIVDLQGVKDRCWINPETGCWVWRGSFSTHKNERDRRPQASIAVGGGKRRTVGVARLAWELAGKEIPDGQVVYRAVCLNTECVSPEHGGCRTKAEAMAAMATAGMFKGSIGKRRAARAMALKTATPVEKVREIEALLAQGLTKIVIQERTGITAKTILRIARKRHIHSEGAQNVLAAGSVFTFTGQIQIQEPAEEVVKRKAANRRSYAGASNPNAKLSLEQQRILRERYAAIKAAAPAGSRDAMQWHGGTGRDTVAKIAKDLGVSTNRVYAIVREAKAA